MKNTDFPQWAPKEIISEWEDKISEASYWHKRFPNLEPDMTDADLIYRLISYEDMKRVWERLPKYKIKPLQFSNMIQLSTLYIESKPYNLAPKEYEQWLHDVKSLALKLSGLIEFSAYDSFLREKYFAKRNRYVLSNMVEHAFKVLEPGVNIEAHRMSAPEYKNWPDLNPGSLSSNLRELAALESDAEVRLLGIKSDSVRLDKPNHPNARRSYFIKKLTQLLREDAGKPLREIVTITAATVFDDQTITERQVIRIAP